MIVSGIIKQCPPRRSAWRDFIDEGKLIETPRSNLCDVEREITTSPFARECLCMDVRWVRSFVSAPERAEST